jgi:hypothetical protein
MSNIRSTRIADRRGGASAVSARDGHHGSGKETGLETAGRAVGNARGSAAKMPL